jgi:uncharacterized protein (TIGR03435 family)
MFAADLRAAKILAVALPLAFVLAGVSSIDAQAQAAPAAPPAFEVASVKAPPPGSMEKGMSMTRSEVRWRGFSLKEYIKTAYGVKDYSLSAPSWLDTAVFNVDAKFPAGAALKDMPAMLQTLLAERFGLVVHHETQGVNGFTLVVDKKGPKIQPVEPGSDPRGATFYKTKIVLKNGSLAQFADALSSHLDRPVNDQTGLAGFYNLSVEWLADDAPLADGPTAVTIFAAVEQLGLRLQSGKVPVEILVVDRMERAPIEN